MDADKINDLVIQGISEKLESLWEFDRDDAMNIVHEINGIITLRDILLDDLAARPQKN